MTKREKGRKSWQIFAKNSVATQLSAEHSQPLSRGFCTRGQIYSASSDALRKYFTVYITYVINVIHYINIT